MDNTAEMKWRTLQEMYLVVVHLLCGLCSNFILLLQIYVNLETGKKFFSKDDAVHHIKMGYPLHGESQSAGRLIKRHTGRNTLQGVSHINPWNFLSSVGLIVTFNWLFFIVDSS